METQHGLFEEAHGSPLVVVNNLPCQTPGFREVLVKPLVISIDPVDQNVPTAASAKCKSTGIRPVSAFCGIVLEVGESCRRLAVGDYVYGLCQSTEEGYSSLQDTFAIQEDLVFKKAKDISLEEASSIGIGILVAAFGIIAGGQIPLPEIGSTMNEKDDWIAIIGGSSLVGQYATQIGRLCGYQVAASCPPSAASVVMTRGATIAFNDRASASYQVAEIKNITDGYLSLVFDATGLSPELGLDALQTSTEDKAHFSTAGTALNVQLPEKISEYQVKIGQLGRRGRGSGDDGDVDGHTTEEAAKMIPVLEDHISNGTLTPVDYEVRGKTGWAAVGEEMDILSSGKRKKAVIVRVQDAE